MKAGYVKFMKVMNRGHLTLRIPLSSRSFLQPIYNTCMYTERIMNYRIAGKFGGKLFKFGGLAVHLCDHQITCKTRQYFILAYIHMAILLLNRQI